MICAAVAYLTTLNLFTLLTRSVRTRESIFYKLIFLQGQTADDRTLKRVGQAGSKGRAQL